MASARQEAVSAIVQKVVEERTNETVTNQEIVLFSDFQKDAQNFLDGLQVQSNLVLHGETLAERIVSVKSMINTIYTGMRNDTEYTRNVLALQHTFEEKLNAFLNRNIYLTYVDDEGNIIAYDDAAIKTIYEQAGVNLGRGNVSKSVMENLNVDDNITEINQQIKTSVAKRIEVYQEAVKRWSDNDSEEKKNYPNSIQTFYWRLKNDFSISGWTSKITTKGVIAEGYAGAVFNDKEDSVINSQIEQSLENLWNKYIEKDSIPAAVKGDIVLEDNGNIQFAIKEGSFSTAKVGQYINLAYNVTRLPKNTLQADFKLALPKLLNVGKTAEKITNILEDNSENYLLKLVNSVVVGRGGSVRLIQ